MELGVGLSLVVEADIAAVVAPGLLSVLVPLLAIVELPPLLVLVLLHLWFCLEQCGCGFYRRGGCH